VRGCRSVWLVGSARAGERAALCGGRSWGAGLVGRVLGLAGVCVRGAPVVPGACIVRCGGDGRARGVMAGGGGEGSGCRV